MPKPQKPTKNQKFTTQNNSKPVFIDFSSVPHFPINTEGEL